MNNFSHAHPGETVLSLEDRVRNIFLEDLGLVVDEEALTLDAEIIKDLGADSLDVVDLIMAFEDEFTLSITDEEVSKIKTVRDCVEFVKAK